MQTRKLNCRRKRLLSGILLVWYVAHSCQRVIALFITLLCLATAEYENKTKLKIKYSH